MEHGDTLNDIWDDLHDVVDTLNPGPDDEGLELMHLMRATLKLDHARELVNVLADALRDEIKSFFLANDGG